MRSLPSPSLARSTIFARTTSRYGDVYSLIEQRADLGRIVGVLVREGLRNYRAVVGINSQMEFAPFATRLRAVFRLQPLTRPVDLKAAAVDQQMQRAVRQ